MSRIAGIYKTTFTTAIALWLGVVSVFANLQDCANDHECCTAPQVPAHSCCMIPETVSAVQLPTKLACACDTIQVSTVPIISAKSDSRQDGKKTADQNGLHFDRSFFAEEPEPFVSQIPLDSRLTSVAVFRLTLRWRC